MIILVYIFLGAIAVLLLWGVGLYNLLVHLHNRAKEGWSDIDVQLKRRHDLIPNLVSSVQGYMKHESGLLETVTKYRAQAMAAQKAGDTKALAGAENILGDALGKLQIAVEAYPDLKANQNVAQLIDELSDTENKIQAARRFYNGLVRDLNIKLELFPNTLFVKMFGFAKFSFFEIEDAAERKNVEVKL